MTDEPVPVAAVPRQVPLLNPANLLTAVRIVLVPVFVVFVMFSAMDDARWRIAACLTFCVASATDYADGWIARRYELVTSFGKVADPIADKALTGSALILLSTYDRLPWWVTLLVLVREWGVTALRFWVIRYGVIPASRGGKLKTALQIGAIAWFLWPVPSPFDVVGAVLMIAALLVTLITGVDYVLQAVRMRAAGMRR
ncbi:CDP-diacylglycerol--glycerol-3-phosphate 3-phosphatidyltransferase [Actinoplanes sp. TFC3]|uniref:CDP-diacylglycerol--glycerol-3-phosphate 3-phosphatidyltransferase n=1 Tax=Actinoplanes sp. TFC3 TaxID=1710355 RepID=UPI00082B15D6|nr:CDP-diacylglycerol--glycerol-3-phosphate 3-phosphatidyltransferase [Actinoplanes sp. TFC3]